MVLTLAEMIGDFMDDEESEAPDVPDYDRQFFPKEAAASQIGNI